MPTMRLPFALLVALIAMSSSPHLSAQNEPAVIRLDSINPYAYRSHLKATQSSLHHWNPTKNEDNEIELWQLGQRRSSRDHLVASSTSDHNLIDAAVSAVHFLAQSDSARLQSITNRAEDGTLIDEVFKINGLLEFTGGWKFTFGSLRGKLVECRSISNSLKALNILPLLGTVDDWPQFNKPDAIVEDAFVHWTLLEGPDGEQYLLQFGLVAQNCDRKMSSSIANLPPLFMEGLHGVEVHRGPETFVEIYPLETNPHAVQLLDDFLDAGYLLELYTVSEHTLSSSDQRFIANAIQPGAELPTVFKDPDQLNAEYNYERFKATFQEEMRKLESEE